MGISTEAVSTSIYHSKELVREGFVREIGDITRDENDSTSSRRVRKAYVTVPDPQKLNGWRMSEIPHGGSKSKGTDLLRPDQEKPKVERGRKLADRRRHVFKWAYIQEHAA